MNLRRKVSGPLRPSWDPTFEALAELFHQGSLRITRLSLEQQRKWTQSVILGLPSSHLYQETVFEKLSGVGGPALFAILVAAGSSTRTAILAVISFFVVGAVILARVDVTRGRAEAIAADAAAAAAA